MIEEKLNELTDYMQNELNTRSKWIHDKDKDYKLAVQISNPFEQLTKNDLRYMAVTCGDAALEDLKIRDYSAGSKYRDVHSVDGFGIFTMVSGSANMTTNSDIRRIQNLIRSMSLQELKVQPFIVSLHKVYLAHKKKHFEEKVFPQLKSRFDEIAEKHEITYDPQTSIFTIQLSNVNEDKLALVSPFSIEFWLLTLKNTIKETPQYSLDTKSPYTAFVGFSPDVLDAVASGTFCGLDCTKLNATGVTDYYYNLYNQALSLINYRVSGLAQSDSTFTPPTQLRRMEEAKQKALVHPRRYSIEFPINLETMNYIIDFVYSSPDMIVSVIKDRVSSDINTELDRVKLTFKITDNSHIFIVPVDDADDEDDNDQNTALSLETVLQGLNDLKLPKLSFQMAQDGILVSRTQVKPAPVLDEQISNNNNANRKINAIVAKNISQEIIARIKIIRPTLSAHYSKAVYQYVLSIETNKNDGTLSNDRTAEVIKTCSDALIDALKQAQNLDPLLIPSILNATPISHAEHSRIY